MAKKIDVFLVFERNQRNSYTYQGVTTIGPGPDWLGLIAELEAKGYDLTVDGPPAAPTVQDLTDSLKTAAVTVFVGHGIGSKHGERFVATQVKLVDGLIQSSDGILKAKFSKDGKTYYPDSGATWEKIQVSNVTAVFTCNSDSELPRAFEQNPGSYLVTNDGGKDGVTRIGTMEQAAYDFVRTYASTGQPQAAVQAAQKTFDTLGKRYAADRGDTVRSNYVHRPRRPSMCDR
jgi:hypothetical protein